MFPSASLLLLALVRYVFCATELIQPDSLLIKPGETLTITCKVSGALITDSSNHYGTAWIRQPAGKTLEWINSIYHNGGINKKDSLKDKFVVTRDTSQNTVTLQGKNMQPEDTAVYYCARKGIYGGGHAFDYWGKGTTVTVTSAVQSAPKSVYPLIQCGPFPDGYVTLGCMTRGLATADGLSFSWRDVSTNKEVTDFVQYPAVSGDGGYISVSHMRVKNSEWTKDSQFKCNVKNALGDKSAELKKPEDAPEQNATLLLTVSTQTDVESEKTTFICLAEHFSPKTGKFQWSLGEVDKTAQAKPIIKSKDKGVDIAVSVLELNTSDWTNSNNPVKCEVSQKAGTVTKEVKHVSGETSQPEVTIIPPFIRNMLIDGVGTLKCTAKGSAGFADIKWVVDKKEVAQKKTSDLEKQTQVSSVAKINLNDWSNGTKFSCEVHHPAFTQTFKTVEYFRVNGKKQMPKVYLLAPPESKDDTVTLTCYVKDFYPEEVAVSWLVNDQHVEDSKHNTSSPIKTGDLFSVYNKLTVKSADWKQGIVYTCRVYHESIKEPVRLISRSISSSSDPPAIMNLNLTIPSACHQTNSWNRSAY